MLCTQQHAERSLAGWSRFDPVGFPRAIDSAAPNSSITRNMSCTDRVFSLRALLVVYHYRQYELYRQGVVTESPIGRVPLQAI
ncbi:hypothetical protein RRG08_014362 [Elysia crispata]|uniref:Uncharacterized protein n=1 Tax=Elysia crispata TaxID=231223 RepID=A0AAE0XP59_9GAST|nr:hypothetical protein RRG08_014362 [Elysia crispata]